MPRSPIIFNLEDLCKKYISLKEVNLTAQYYGVSEAVIRKNLKIFNIPLNKITRTRNRKSIYNIDSDFFKNDSEESFYVSGFIAADGCMNKNTITISLSSKDKKHLNEINKILKSNRSIYHYNNEYSGVSKLIFTSKEMCEDLKRFNITPKKSLTYIFPEWIKNHPLKHHFIRGYVDGDGSFYLQKQFKEKVCFSVRGTQNFLMSLRKILELECNFVSRTNEIPISGNIGQLNYGGNKNIYKIYKFLYNNANIFLNRKKEIAKYAGELLYVNT